MSYTRSITPIKAAIRCMSNVANSESSLIKGKKSFVVVNGVFKPMQGEDLPTVTEEITHTGQFFEEKDWRRNRFMDRSKTVNKNWAVKMVNEIPPIEVDARIAYCEGRDGPEAPAALGHPRVYINLDKGKAESCMYCGLKYIKKSHH